MQKICSPGFCLRNVLFSDIQLSLPVSGVVYVGYGVARKLLSFYGWLSVMEMWWFMLISMSKERRWSYTLSSGLKDGRGFLLCRIVAYGFKLSAL